VVKVNDVATQANGVPDPEALPPVRRWEVLGRRSLYESKWISLSLLRVVPPDREPYEHHVAEVADAVGVVLCHAEKGVLLLHRHRLITDTVGYEIPAGGIDDGESIEQAAAREVLEETGWTVRDMVPLLFCNASDGASDQRFHFMLAHTDRFLGEPTDDYEASSRVWVDRARISELIGDGSIPGALSTVALLYALHFGHL
jgi:8-oxo-dGTP pyrophosphatase MutT (NUDIX family)